MSSSPTVSSATPAPDPDWPAAGKRWLPWGELRSERRTLAFLLLGLAVVGVPLGLLWWGVAPRADFRITSGGPVVIGHPSEELQVADDSVYVLIMVAFGLLAGAGAWLVRRTRGLAGLLGVALGCLAASAVAWQVGELLGPGPSHAALTHVGGRVTTSLSLNMLPALAVAPFFAVLVQLVAALYARNDGLGRDGGRPEPAPGAEDALS